MAILNSYRAVFKNDESKESEVLYCNASSMIKAIQYMIPNKDKEPYLVSLVQENVLTEPKEETFVSLETICVDDNDEIVENCASYPSLIDNIIRGSIIYIDAISNNEEYVFKKWIDNEENEYEENPLKINITTDESINELRYKAIFEKIA